MGRPGSPSFNSTARTMEMAVEAEVNKLINEVSFKHINFFEIEKLKKSDIISLSLPSSVSLLEGLHPYTVHLQVRV